VKYVRSVRKKAEDRGASAVEYGLMVAAIAAMIVGTVFVLGNMVKTQFQHTANCIAQNSDGFSAPTLADGSPDPNFKPEECPPATGN
jgi:pilus assembly protein Flp/PilA